MIRKISDSLWENSSVEEKSNSPVKAGSAADVVVFAFEATVVVTSVVAAVEAVAAVNQTYSFFRKGKRATVTSTIVVAAAAADVWLSYTPKIMWLLIHDLTLFAI